MRDEDDTLALALRIRVYIYTPVAQCMTSVLLCQVYDEKEPERADVGATSDDDDDKVMLNVLICQLTY